MRFVMYGAGAIGGVAAARLTQAGEDVVAIARGEHLARIRADGLEVVTPVGREHVRLETVAHPSEITWTGDEVVLLAMKTQDTQAALDALRAVAPADVPIVCLQNGVENERMAARVFPHVYGCMITAPTVYLEPGTVYAYSNPCEGVFDMGRYPSGVDDTITAVSKAFDGATFSSQVHEHVMRDKYAKLLLNLVNAVEALCGTGVRGGPLVELLQAEGRAVFDAAGIDVATVEEGRARSAVLNRQEIAGQPRGGGSSWQSLARGSSIETDYLNGEIVLLGRLHGVPTPGNVLVQRLMVESNRQGAAPGSMTEEEILAQVASA